MYCFEDVFHERVARLRTEEIKLLTKAGLLTASAFSLVQAGTLLPPLISFLIYIGTGSDLTVSKAFTSLALINGMWFAFHMLGLGLTKVGMAKPCLMRLKTLMDMPEIQTQLDWKTELAENEAPSIEIKNAKVCCI